MLMQVTSNAPSGNCCELGRGVRSGTGVLVSGEEHQVGPIVLRMLRMLEPRQLLVVMVQDVNSQCPTVAGAGDWSRAQGQGSQVFSSCQVTHLPRNICRALPRFVLCPVMEGAVKHIHYMHLLIFHAMPGPGSSAGWRILNTCTKPGLFVLRCL